MNEDLTAEIVVRSREDVFRQVWVKTSQMWRQWAVQVVGLGRASPPQEQLGAGAPPPHHHPAPLHLSSTIFEVT